MKDSGLPARGRLARSVLDQEGPPGPPAAEETHIADSRTVRWINAARAERHVIREFVDGAVLIDVDTGEVLQLNQTAALVYSHLVRGAGVEDVALALSARFEITKAQASVDISSFLDTVPVALVASPTDDPSPFEYLPVGDLFAVCRGKEPILHVHPSGEWVALAGGLTNVVRAALIWIVPKVLVLQGHPVLHASAVSVGNRGIAFSGRSGAGKTTLARSFASAGALLLAEDAFLLGVDQTRGTVGLAPLEDSAFRWADRALSGAPNPGARIECDLLRGRDDTRPVRLAEVMFLDANRRQGRTLRKRPMGQTASVVALLQNLFWGASNAVSYERALNWSVAISRSVEVHELTVPAGIPHLLSATRNYTENMAS